MNFEKLLSNLNDGVYTNNLEYPSRSKFKKLRTDYVFDENLSVKKNREMVLKHNEEIESLYAKYETETNRINDIFYSDLIKALKNNYSFNDKICEKIFAKAYQDAHSEGKYSIIQKVEEYADFIDEILNLQ